MTSKLSFLGKMKLAETAYAIYEEFQKQDRDHTGIADYKEDADDLKAIYHACQNHDAAAVLEHVEAIIRRSGPDFLAVAAKLGVDLKKV